MDMGDAHWSAASRWASQSWSDQAYRLWWISEAVAGAPSVRKARGSACSMVVPDGPVTANL